MACLGKEWRLQRRCRLTRQLPGLLTRHGLRAGFEQGRDPVRRRWRARLRTRPGRKKDTKGGESNPQSVGAHAVLPMLGRKTIPVVSLETGLCAARGLFALARDKNAFAHTAGAQSGWRSNAPASPNAEYAGPHRAHRLHPELAVGLPRVQISMWRKPCPRFWPATSR